jgi:hypothetical protein
MPAELIQLLYQFPIVAIFIWYAERKDKQFQEFLREERQERFKQIELLAREIKELNTAQAEGHRRSPGEMRNGL